jgi:hypothetical protein
MKVGSRNGAAMLVLLLAFTATFAFVVAAPFAATQSPRAAEANNRDLYFTSPTGNIRCRYFPSTATVGCLTRNNGIETMLTLRGRPYAQPISHVFPAGRVLSYGRAISFSGNFRCTSRTDGMFCKSLASGRCFLTARGGQRFVCAAPRNVSAPPPPSPSGPCHPSYVPCLDKPGDYDCIGGSGDGPNYTGTMRVIGYDEYRLDADGDGIGCEES